MAGRPCAYVCGSMQRSRALPLWALVFFRPSFVRLLRLSPAMAHLGAQAGRDGPSQTVAAEARIGRRPLLPGGRWQPREPPTTFVSCSLLEEGVARRAAPLCYGKKPGPPEQSGCPAAGRSTVGVTMRCPQTLTAMPTTTAQVQQWSRRSSRRAR